MHLGNSLYEAYGFYNRQAGCQLVPALCGGVWNQVHHLRLCRICLVVQSRVYPKALAFHEVKQLVPQRHGLQQQCYSHTLSFACACAHPSRAREMQATWQPTWDAVKCR